MSRGKFNKKVFALLLEKAKGERSWRKFAADCEISYIQMLKLAKCEQENSPRPKLIGKIGERSENGIGVSDFYFAAGLEMESEATEPEDLALWQRFEALSAGRRKAAAEYIDFLYCKDKDKGLLKEKDECEGNK